MTFGRLPSREEPFPPTPQSAGRFGHRIVTETRREHLGRLATMVVGGVGVAACAQPRPAAGPSPRDPRRRVRVGLALGVSSVQVGARGAVVAAENGSTVVRMRSGDSVSVRQDGDGLRAAGGGRSGRFGSLTFRPADRGALVTVGGAAYRGTVGIARSGSGINVINELGLEEYVQSVVGAEMGTLAGSQRAALAAQAVASRTYAVANLGRFQRQGFDVRAGVTDQVYRGVQSEIADGNRAVRDTRGLVMTYGGDVIVVFFHSTCGYATASPEEVFRTVRPRPYLTSVSDRRGRGERYYCAASPQFRWRVEWDGAQLSEILRSTVPQSLGIDAGRVTSIHDVRVRATGLSGRATEIRVRVEGGEIPVFGPDVRAVFRTPAGRPLGSTAVQLSSDRSGGRLVRLVAAGAGWGHGVGMCQWGAIGRSADGQSFRDILAAYYPGTDVSG